LQRSGIRVVTIWDDATPMQRASYEKYCRNLYGATVQNFKDVPSVHGSVENQRVHFDKLVIPYVGSYDHIRRSIDRELRRWDGESPRFLAYQLSIWGEMKPERIVELALDVASEFPDKVKFVRADHYFNLYNEAHRLPFNLAMSSQTTIRDARSSENAKLAIDGTPSTVWTSPEREEQWLEFDLGDAYRINRYVIRHAGEYGMSPDHNTRACTVQVSQHGASWTTVDVFRENTSNVTDVDLNPIPARYFRIIVDDAGCDSIARIAEVEIFGAAGS
jgi:hypothetical protein